jgi:tol-pal system protein YbgF
MRRSFALARPISALPAVSVLRLATVTIALLLIPYSSLMASETEEQPESSGTGFIVTRLGHILTNHHVVDGCVSIRATTEAKQYELALVGSDEQNDLAVLQMTGRITYVGRFRDERSVLPTETVVAVGYPLQGVLASEATISMGRVSAPARPVDDGQFVQMTAPVEPGHSGGPLLDQGGFIIGVVENRLNAFEMLPPTGDFPQQVDFAVKWAVAKGFLDAHHIKYDTGISTLAFEPADIGEAAKRFTLLLQCYTETLEARYHRLLAEQRALEAERGAIERRRALARSDRAGGTRKLAIERETQEYERKAQRNAFDLAYHEFRNGSFDRAAIAFQRVVKDYPTTILTANALYWLGESYYHQHDYLQAIKAFEHMSREYPANEKMPASLLKLGQAAKHIGDANKSKKSFKRVIEEFPSSDAATLAKKKLADFR